MEEQTFWEWMNLNSGGLNVVSAFVLAGITACYVYLTWRLVCENRELRKLSSRPEIGISLSLHEAYFHIINLSIQNIGQGAAYNIRLRTDHTFSTSFLECDISELGPFKNGIGLLLPCQGVEVPLANMIKRFDELKKQSLHITAEWKDSTAKLYKREYTIDFSEYENVVRVGTPPLYEIANAVGEIEKCINHFSTGWHKLPVVVHTAEDVQRTDRANMLLAMLQGLPEQEFDEVFSLVNSKLEALRPSNESRANKGE